MDVLRFEVDGHGYALPISAVREVLRATAVVSLPRAPRVVLGIMNLHGELLAVLDLRTRFGAPQRTLQPDEHFIVIDAGVRRVVLRADRATGLTRIDAGTLRPVEPVVARSEFVAGLGTVEDGVVLIVDPAAFLRESEGEALDEALAAARGAVRASARGSVHG